MIRMRIFEMIGLATAALVFLSITVTLVSADDMPGGDAAALWEFITVTDSYKKWEFWPGKEGLYKGSFPHGAQVKLYVNRIALEAARAGKEMPPGAIILKENYGKDGKKLIAVTPMFKIKGFNPAGDDWFWAKYKADGSVEKSGKLENCIECHSSVRYRNWIFSKVK